MSKVLLKPKVDVEEKQSLEQAQEMMVSVFSSIAYIRDLFTDENYEETKVAGMQIKKLKKGSNPSVNQLISWIENGCFDALNKKCLESVILGIFEDSKNPTEMIETYTLTMEYPSSPLHQQLKDACRPNPIDMKLTVNKGGQEKTEHLDSKNFQKEIAALLRSLCVLTQTLAPLPEKRFLTMQITYYDELTPADYEPPGFTPQAFDINFIFTQPTMKHTFNVAQSNHHKIGLSLETLAFEPKTPVKNISEAMVPSTAIAEAEKRGKVEDTDRTQTPPMKETQAPLIDQMKNIKVTPESKLNDSKTVLVSGTQDVRCSCEDSDTDLDMIQCDKCGHWQHTPCMGFCSNRDKRIPKTNYICYICKYGNPNSQFGKFLKNLAGFRRVVALLYTDGFQSIAELSRRLSCNIKRASAYVKQLEEEGLIERKHEGSKVIFAPCSGPAVKEKLNYYFGTDPEKMKNCPLSSKKRVPTEAPLPVAIDNVKKRRKSLASQKIDA